MGLYLLLINVITFVIYALDKLNAKTDSWRISERTLLNFTILGGSVGALLGMIVCRHKIRNRKFSVGVPLILIGHIIIFVLCLKETAL